MRIHAITLGCQMSAADGAETLAALSRLGWQRTESRDDADAILMTTCAVRRHAEHRAISLIGSLREWKAHDPRRFLAVTGCVAQRLGRRLTQRFPHVDLVVGARSAARYPELLAAELEKRFGVAAPPLPGKENACPSRTARPCAPPSGGNHDASSPNGDATRYRASAFVTIMRGCDCACSYCVVPAVRGPEICRPPEEILAEVREKVAGGVREVTLLGQRVNAYACVRNGRRTDFADLLRLVDGIAGLRRLRFMSPHPGLCCERTAAAVRECRTVCPWVHLPVQSGCDRLLGVMRRGYTRAEFLRTVARLRRAVPGVVLSTDIIVGFPSETEEEFAQSLALLEELRPATAFCFKYSAREGTPAAALPDDVPPRVKEERLAATNAVVDRLTVAALRSQVGSVVEVLAESPTFGRTRTGFKVRWERPVAPGSLVQLRIGSATRRNLLGDIHEP